MDAKEWGEFVNGVNRMLLERAGASVYMIIQNPGRGADVVTNVTDPVEQIGMLHACTIIAEDWFRECRRLAFTPNVEEHLNNTAQTPPGQGNKGGGSGFN